MPINNIDYSKTIIYKIQHKEKPELFQWWIDIENESKHQFKKEITYQQIKDKSQNQLGLWDNDSSFECFCNID